MPDPKHDRVVAALTEHLQGRTELYWGEQSALARRLGCSRQTLAAITLEIGVRVGRPEKRHCTRCRRLISDNRTSLCRRCWSKPDIVSLTCTNCGKRFQRRRHLHDRFLARTVTQRRRGPVCKRNCLVRYEKQCFWCGRTSKSRQRRPTPATRWCALPRRCRANGMRTLAMENWRHLTPGMLPMRDHLLEISQLRATLKTPPPGSLP